MPNIDNKHTGMKLACCGAISDQVGSTNQFYFVYPHISQAKCSFPALIFFGKETGTCVLVPCQIVDYKKIFQLKVISKGSKRMLIISLYAGLTLAFDHFLFESDSSAICWIYSLF